MRELSIDIRAGGIYKYDDGKEIEIEPHSDRVSMTFWHNGAAVETLCYSQPQESHVNSDRIHLLITDCNGESIGWIMNIEDANSIIIALSRAIEKAIDLGIPVREE